jgi:hypothetical protein
MEHIQDQLELNALFEDAPPMGSTKVAVVIGRFNPPTIGHYKLIGEAVKGIKNLNQKHKGLNLDISPVILIVGSDEKHAQMMHDLQNGTDKAKKTALEKVIKAPLPPSDIIYTMKNSGKLNIIPDKHYFASSGVPQGLNAIREAGLEPIAIIMGGDRGAKEDGSKSDYMRILDNYFKDDNGEPIEHYEIVVARAEDTNTKKDEKAKFIDDVLTKAKTTKSSIADTDASGSMARRAVQLGYAEEFAKIVGLEDKPALAKKIFNKIALALKE